MTWSAFLFSPSGRINRARYWGAFFIQYGVGAALWIPIAILADTHFGDDHPTVAIVYVAVVVVATIALIVSHVFAQIKRFHDRDKSWPWIFIQFIPYIGGIWMLVELGMLSGTKGRNRHGSDPLGRVGDIVDVFDGPSPIDPPLAIEPNAAQRPSPARI